MMNFADFVVFQIEVELVKQRRMMRMKWRN